MSDFVIIPDTACDLSKELRERFGIEDYLRGTLYYPDGHDELISLDWDKMTPDEYYTSMKGRNVLYKTASVPMGQMTEVFEKYLSQGKDVLSISISSGLSATYNESLMVAKDLQKKYPDRKIYCVDSLRYSTALALLVVMACEKKNEGATIDETYKYIEDTKNTVHQMGSMSDLFFLVKTGRISNFKALFGTLVGVNAMADFNDKGLAEVIKNTKGMKTALDYVIKYMEKTIINPEEQIIFVCQSLREKQAQLLADMIKERFNPKEIIINPVGMACGANIGPGLVAAFYQGTQISPNLKKEKQIMDEIEADSKAKK